MEFVFGLKFKVLLLFAFNSLSAYNLMRARQEKNKYFSILLGLASFYPLGKVLQFWHWGPILVRCYLSDIGFVPMSAVLPIAVLLNWKTVSAARRFADLGLLAALGIEFLQILANPRLPDGQFGARGDWWDVIIFLVNWTVVRLLLNKLEGTVQKPEPQVYRKKKRNRRHRRR